MSKSITFPVSEDLHGLLVDAAWAADMGVSEFVAFKLETLLLAEGVEDLLLKRKQPITPWADEAQHAVDLLLERKGAWVSTKDLLFRLVKNKVLPYETARFPGPLSQRLVRSYGVQRRCVNGCAQLRLRSSSLWPTPPPE